MITLGKEIRHTGSIRYDKNFEPPIQNYDQYIETVDGSIPSLQQCIDVECESSFQVDFGIKRKIK